jgi:hypothetical protein
MTAIVTVETILLILLSLLVAGLLRSHAEILRRLEEIQPSTGGSDPSVERARSEPTRVGGMVDPDLPPGRPAPTPAFDIGGTTLSGDAIKISVTDSRTNTLIAFLSSGCRSCQEFWEGLEPPMRPAIPGDARIVVVTKDTSHESPSALLDLAPRDVPVVMSSAAWDQYGIQGSPYFVYVDGRAGQVIGEGTASAWPQVLSLIRDAFADAELAAAMTGPRSAGMGDVHGGSRMSASARRARRAEDELRAAGIGPEDPSLYGRSERA